MKYTTVGSKQAGDNLRWQYVWENIEDIVPIDHCRKLVDDTAREIDSATRLLKVGYGWSGGKDSQALKVVMDLVGINQCVLGMTLDLEYPDFLRWVTDVMPPMLDVVHTGQDIDWLIKHKKMLFPQDSTTAAKWFRVVQHKAQRIFCKRYGLDILILGRRHADRNYTGRDGTGIYTSKGITRYSPIRKWSHEETLAVCHYWDMPMSPHYGWVNGWVVGSGCWPARQWTGSERNGWEEIAKIDRAILKKAMPYFPIAKQVMMGTL